MKNLQLNIILFIVLGISLFIYVSYRAQHLSFTHDESLSFTIINGDSTYIKSANNHILNTKLMKVSSSIFGNNELALRLPNVLSFILYLFSGFFILKTIKTKLVFYLGFALLYLNPFLIDYFSLARGYGLSIAFLSLSLAFLLEQISLKSNGTEYAYKVLLSMAAASLALWSNFTLLNFFLGVLIVQLFIIVKNKNILVSKLSKIIFFTAILLGLVNLTFSIKMLMQLNDLNQLYFGEDHFLDSLKSIICSSFYRSFYPNFYANIFSYLFIASIFVVFLVIIKNKDFESKLFILFLNLAIIILGLYLENYLFSAKFPTERTSLFFVPLIALFLCFALEHIILYYGFKKYIYYPVVVSFSCFIIINFSKAANLNYSKTFFNEANSKDALELIQHLTCNSASNSTISNNWIFEPVINYYIFTNNLKLNKANRNGINLNADFIFTFNADTIPEFYSKKQEFQLTATSVWQRN
jgi:hypothetical protein